jgi:NAD(P)-dependent dehydrogenase (short-subunit alcohol dehydrogenase family)
MGGDDGDGASQARLGLRGHVVVITGATRGIGLGIAKYLASQGCNLAVTGRKPEPVRAACEVLAGYGIAVIGDAGDGADRGQLPRLAARAFDRFGRIDGLVANAQTFRPVTPLADVTPDDVRVLFGTGPEATLWAMQAVFPYMRARGRGRIVTMGSALGLTGAVGYGPYSASKEAIRSLTRTAAREWGGDGILVNCVCPASVAHRRPPADPARAASFAAMYADHPLGRDGDPETDIAPTVAYLLSDACSYMTGQTLMVDGGGIMRA